MRSICLLLLLASAAIVHAAYDEEVAYDPDEFEGVEQGPPPPSPAARGPAAPPPVATTDPDIRALLEDEPEPAPSVQRKLLDYPYEIAALTMLALFAINFIVGRRRNIQIATLWYRGAMPVFDHNFAHLGREEKSQAQLWKDSPNVFYFYATGRLNCDSCLVKLDLCSRQDFFAVLVNFFRPQKDHAIYNFEIPANGLDDFVVAVVQRREEQSIRQEFPDIDKFGRRVGIGGLGDSLVCLSDSAAAAEAILTQSAAEVLARYAPYIRSLHFSDRLLGTPAAPKSGIVMTLYVNPRENGGDLARSAAVEALSSVALQLVDRARNVKLAQKERERTKALRAAVEAEEFRQNSKSREEEIQRKKMEAIANMSPEEQAKLKEKIAKREAKKASKVMKVMKFRT